MTLNAREEVNESTMLYLKARIFSPEGSSPQEGNNNLPAEDEVQDDKDEKESWRKKIGLPQ